MSSSPSPKTLQKTPAKSQFPSQFSTMTGSASLVGSRRRSTVFAAAFGLILVGGIFYFVLSAMTDDARDAPSAEVQAPAAVAAASVAPVARVAAQPIAVPAAPTVYFPYKLATLNADTRAALDIWVVRMQTDKKLTVSLGGHADERGRQGYNYRLGARRAQTAKAYLVGKGIEASRISAVSFGKQQPVAAGHDERAWSQNRRVELRSVIAMSQR